MFLVLCLCSRWLPLLKSVKLLSFLVKLCSLCSISSDFVCLSVFAAGPHRRRSDEKRSLPCYICTLHCWLTGRCLGLREPHSTQLPLLHPSLSIWPPPPSRCLWSSLPSSSLLASPATLFKCHCCIIDPAATLRGCHHGSCDRLAPQSLGIAPCED